MLDTWTVDAAFAGIRRGRHAQLEGRAGHVVPAILDNQVEAPDLLKV